jgi:hypothetical protein
VPTTAASIADTAAEIYSNCWYYSDDGNQTFRQFFPNATSS